jgi:hypothetical protein
MPNRNVAVVTCAFAYTAKAWFRRVYGEQAIEVRGVAEIPIEDLSSIEAPVAIRIHPPKEKLPWRTGRDPQAMIELRWDGSKLLRPMLGPDGNHISAAGFIAAMAGEGMPSSNGAPKEALWLDNPLLLTKEGPDGRPMQAPLHRLAIDQQGRTDARSWDPGDREAKAAELRERASRVSFVDGMAYRDCPEPTWEVSFGPLKQPIRVRTTDPVPTFGMMFALDALDDVRRCCEMFGLAASPDDTVEILVPEAIRRSTFEMNTTSLFETVTPQLAEEVLQLASTAGIRAWADLKDAEIAWWNGDPQAVHDGYAAVERLLSVDWTRSPRSEYAKRDRKPSGYCATPFLRIYETLGISRDNDGATASGPTR